jgi:hypothetical protein
MRRFSYPFFALLAIIMPTGPVAGQVSSELYDYLVQDVCLDGTGKATQGDPATCQNRRNIGVYERSPYLLTDWDNVANTSYQAISSFPIIGEDGLTRVMVSKNFAGNFGPEFTFSFMPTRGDGYDLVDINFKYAASFIRTFDGGCFDQLWAPALNLSGIQSPYVRAGGWVLFPLVASPSSWPQTSAVSNNTAKIQLSSVPGNPDCVSGSSVARTYWNAPANYQFESGKVLRAIKSAHFAATNLSSTNNALELYYFTKEYGYTRWEAWVPRSRCYQIASNTPAGNLRPHCEPDLRVPNTSGNPELDLRSRCSLMNVSATGHPDIDRWGEQDWVRIDCRDSTRHVPLATPQLMLSTSMAQTNGVDDVDFLSREGFETACTTMMSQTPPISLAEYCF